MVAIAHVVTALHVVSGTLLIVDRLEGGGVAATSDLSPATSRSRPACLPYPALLVMHGAAVFFISRLVDVFTLTISQSIYIILVQLWKTEWSTGDQVSNSQLDQDQ